MFTNRSHFGSRLGSLQAQLAGHARLGSSSHTDIYIYIYLYIWGMTQRKLYKPQLHRNSWMSNKASE